MRTINPAISPKTFSQEDGDPNASVKPIRNARITDLYQEALHEAARLRAEATTKPTAFVRTNFREKAQSLEIRATRLAHCIAMYGDQEILSMNLDRLLTDAYGLVCNGSNPWAQGLALIQATVRELHEH